MRVCEHAEEGERLSLRGVHVAFCGAIAVLYADADRENLRRQGLQGQRRLVSKTRAPGHCTASAGRHDPAHALCLVHDSMRLDIGVVQRALGLSTNQYGCEQQKHERQHCTPQVLALARPAEERREASCGPRMMRSQARVSVPEPTPVHRESGPRGRVHDDGNGVHRAAVCRVFRQMDAGVARETSESGLKRAGGCRKGQHTSHIRQWNCWWRGGSDAECSTPAAPL